MVDEDDVNMPRPVASEQTSRQDNGHIGAEAKFTENRGTTGKQKGRTRVRKIRNGWFEHIYNRARREWGQCGKKGTFGWRNTGSESSILKS